jgi:hypothetical protein
MEYWEFLIQREGDRGWRTIETGNLQLPEGKYRIVANSDAIDTQIQTRVTHQTPGPTVPQRRSQSRTQTTNPRGLLAILPFTQLQSGIWQFVCSGTTTEQVAWQRRLKLRVLPRISHPAPANELAEPMAERIQPPAESLPSTLKEQIQTQVSPVFAKDNDRFDLPAPTAPIVPISMDGVQENYADGLDRLLEQLERESLQPQPPKAGKVIAGTIQLTQIYDSPSQLISLNRSTFSGIIPGNRLTVRGTCNLQRLDGKLIKAVKIEKLSICIRHPQTAEIIGSIEQPLPPHLDTFTFSGNLELPTSAQIGFLVGEVSLYDKHNIQIGSHGFTVTLSLDPLQDAELSFFQSAEEHPDSTAELLAQLTAELQLESATVSDRRSSLLQQDRPPIPSPSFNHPDIVPVAVTRNQPAQAQSDSPYLDITGDLEIDFALSSFVRQYEAENYENLEIVVDN